MAITAVADKRVNQIFAFDRLVITLISDIYINAMLK